MFPKGSIQQQIFEEAVKYDVQRSLAYRESRSTPGHEHGDLYHAARARAQHYAGLTDGLVRALVLTTGLAGSDLETAVAEEAMIHSLAEEEVPADADRPPGTSGSWGEA